MIDLITNLIDLITNAPNIIYWVITIGISIYTIHRHNVAGQLKNTFDLIVTTENNIEYKQNYSIFLTAKTLPNSLSSLQHNNDVCVRTAVIAYLNHCEFIALAIKRNIINEQVYKEHRGSSIIRHFNAAEQFIKHIRETNPQAYILLEALVCKWKKDKYNNP